MTLHQIRTHPEPVDGCYGCRLGSVQVGGIGKHDRTRQKAWDKELQDYRDATAQGIQPETTRTRGIRAAVEWSDKTGIAYSADRKDAHDRQKAMERLP